MSVGTHNVCVCVCVCVYWRGEGGRRRRRNRVLHDMVPVSGVWGVLTWFGCEAVARGNTGISMTWYVCHALGGVAQTLTWVNVNCGSPVRVTKCVKQLCSPPQLLETTTLWRHRVKRVQLHIFLIITRFVLLISGRLAVQVQNFSFRWRHCQSYLLKRRISDTCRLSGYCLANGCMKRNFRIKWWFRFHPAHWEEFVLPLLKAVALLLVDRRLTNYASQCVHHYQWKVR
jgi:hypothetical protein